MPSALSTLDALEAAPNIQLKAVASFDSTWDHLKPSNDLLEASGCKDVDLIWRIGESKWEGNGCGNVTWIRCVLHLMFLRYYYAVDLDH